MSILDEINERYYAILFTYKTVGFSNLASHYLREDEIKTLHNIISTEMSVIQTCNRVEIYLYTEDASKVDLLLSFLDKIHKKEISKDATILKGLDAIKHLFQVAAGIDSLAVGEYEILGQIKMALDSAIKIGASGKHIETLFQRGIKVGRKVRRLTNISKGKVGLYSLAIDLAKSKVDLRNSKILIIGAGDIASKVVSMLKSENVKDVTIMNRTFEKAKELAEKFGYKYVNFDLNNVRNFDVIFSAIFYPYKIIIDDKLIFDLSFPPVFQGNMVYTLENLQQISYKLLEKRMKEIDKANSIIEESISEFIVDYENLKYDAIISQIMSTIEEIRKNEVARAIRKLNSGNNESVNEILDAMTRSMIKKIFSPMLSKIKDYVKTDEKNYINLILELFNYGELSSTETKKIKEEQISKGSGS